MAKGHLDLQRKGLHSTKPPTSAKTKLLPQASMISLEDIVDEDSVFTVIMHRSETENHSDATGRLPVSSYHGNNYLLVSV